MFAIFKRVLAKMITYCLILCGRIRCLWEYVNRYVFILFYALSKCVFGVYDNR